MPDDLEQAFHPSYPDQKQIDEFYSSLGQSIAAWQHVEARLYEVYQSATLPGIPGAAAAAFHAMQTTSMKVSSVDMAVRFVLLRAPQHNKEWKDLRDRIRRESDRRNSLAHGTVQINQALNGGPPRIRLSCATYDFGRKIGLKIHNDIGIVEIRHAKDRFIKLDETIKEFSRCIFLITRKWRE